ncbi:isochorismatase family protein [Citricoccus alkalitolerans]|uniref:Isochorismatase family protein n=1 Tax=Citricoccus alkalitolerans TaxID=246603 RepID=A0ABV8Y1J0_9MICC
MTTPRRALIIVDVQNDYFDADGPLAIQYPPREDSLAHIVSTINTAQQAGMPVAVVQHEYPEGAPVFAAGSEGWKIHPDVEAAVDSSAKRVTKSYASVFAGTGMTDWVRDQGVDTLTLVGYMTNNCVLGTAADAEPLDVAVEVLSDATGAVHLANAAGSVSAQQLHETLMVLLHSNFAAVATTEDWTAAVAGGTALPTSDLGSSAIQGRQAIATV